MSGNQAHLRMTKRTRYKRRTKPMAIYGNSPSPLVARIVDDGKTYSAVILNNRGPQDFEKIFATDLNELHLRLRQNGIASQA